MTDHLVLFMPSGKRGRFPTDTPVLDAARQLGVHVESVCGGRGICGRCQVDVQEGVFAKHGITSSNEHISPFGGNEVRYAEKRDLKAGRRLSCSAKILGDLVIDIPQDAVVNAQVVRKDSDGRVIERNPAIHMCYVEVEEPDMHKPLGDLDRLLMAFEADWGFKGLAIDAYLYGQVQQVLRKGDWKVTAAVHEPVERGRSCNTDRALSRPEERGLRHRLRYRLDHHRHASVVAAVGPHARLVGHIQPADPLRRRPDEPGLLRDDEPGRPRGHDKVAVREAINGLIDKVCKEGEIDRADILDAVFVGNPIMHHLFWASTRPSLAAHPSRWPSPARSTSSPPRSTSRSTPAPGSTCCPASPAMSAPTRPQRHSPKARTARTR
jgi:ferredoxin